MAAARIAGLAVLLCICGQASAGYLQWTYTAPLGNYPPDSPYPPPILRGRTANESDLVVLLSYPNNTWTVTALDTTEGFPVWSNDLSIVFESVSGLRIKGLSAGVATEQPANALHSVLMLASQTATALDATGGAPLWMFEAPEGGELKQVYGWAPANASDPAFLRPASGGAPFADEGGALPAGGVVYAMHLGKLPATQRMPYERTAAHVTALEADTGRVLWDANISSQAMPKDVPPIMETPQTGPLIHCIAPAPGLLLYGAGGYMMALGAANGSVAWVAPVAALSGGGGGSRANITDLQYVDMGEWGGVVLVTAVNWGFQRFAAYRLNGTRPYLLWQSKQPEQAMPEMAFWRPSIGALDGQAYYFANRSLWTTKNVTIQNRMVAVKLVDGRETWSTHIDPVSLPAPYPGRVYVVTQDRMTSLHATGGQEVWGYYAQPYLSFEGSRLSFPLGVAFSNDTGQLAVVRCLGDGALPDQSMCAYSGFQRPPASGAAAARAGALAVAAAAAAWWLLGA